MRYQFSVVDVLLMKVLVVFPFALSKEDKQFSGEDPVTWRSHRDPLVERGCGPNLSVQVSVECKAFRWDRRRIVSNPGVLGGEPVFRVLAYLFSMLHRFFARGLP